MNKFALDTNILIYSHEKNASEKQNIARNLIVSSPIICTQVVSEYINVLNRIMKISKTMIFNVCMPNLRRCQIQSVDIDTLQKAEYLVKYYDFQIFDAVIVASALNSGCQILYSEDMQHKMVINKQLTIINPFL